MLGEKIGEEHGKVTSRRVLPGNDFRYVQMEITFETQVEVFGLKGANMGTYTVFERVSGQLYGEGRGIVMLENGESAIWNGHGVGHMTGEGMGIAFASSVAFQAPATGALARLNGVLVLVEHATADDGSAHSTLFEWKT